MALFIFLPPKGEGACYFFGLASLVSIIQFAIISYFQAHNEVEEASHSTAKNKQKKIYVGRDPPSPGGCTTGNKKMGKECSAVHLDKL